jgi:hypothetical protein
MPNTKNIGFLKKFFDFYVKNPSRLQFWRVENHNYCIHLLFNRLGIRRSWFRPRFIFSRPVREARPRILILGVAVLYKENTFRELKRLFNQSKFYEVTQRWVGISNNVNPVDSSDIDEILLEKQEKFHIINNLLEKFNPSDFDYIMICDDDVTVSNNFIDDYFDILTKAQFDLSQPARTWKSNLSHPITRRHFYCSARQTDFVEIGPIFVLARRAFETLLPFQEDAPMGWGINSLWQKMANQGSIRAGIIDCVPVDHAMRGTGALYDISSFEAKIKSFFEKYQITPRSPRNIKKFGLNIFGVNIL